VEPSGERHLRRGLMGTQRERARTRLLQCPVRIAAVNSIQ
jgi:hypothetical protein